MVALPQDWLERKHSVRMMLEYPCSPEGCPECREGPPTPPERPYSDLDELDVQHDAGVYRDPFSGRLMNTEGLP